MMSDPNVSSRDPGGTPPGPLRLLVLQQAGWGDPATEDVAANAHQLAEWTDSELAEGSVDIAVLPELSTTPYFCCRKDQRYVDWAEPVPGPTTDLFSEVASRHETTIVLPLYEQAGEQHFNAAVVIGPEGELIDGDFRGERMGPYHKCHVPTIQNPPDTEAWEDWYFTPGAGFPVFETAKASVGILICYDRWFPEAWRMVATAGAEVVLVPMVAWGFVEDPYLSMLQSRAVENGVFVASCNRAGIEVLDGVRMDHFGRSAVIGPDGRTITIAPPGATQLALRAELDLSEIERQRRILPMLAHRRTDLYGEPQVWTGA